MRALYKHPDPKLRYLVRSHGAHRWAQRLCIGKDVAQCGIYRQAHHEKITVEDLSKEAQGLCQDMEKLGEGEPDWQAANEKLAEVVDALKTASEPAPGRLAPAEGLFALRELLKQTEKGSMDDERCSAFEMEEADVPGHMLRYLKADTTGSDPTPERWDLFCESFGDHSKQSRKGLTRLMKALHAVIETGEALPVWRHKKERGLKALIETLPLKLRHLPGSEEETCSALELHLPKSAQAALLVSVEPLVPVADINRYLFKVTPCTDPLYLSYCHRLVGCSIRDQDAEKTFEVEGFEILSQGLPIAVHVLRPPDGGDSQRMILANRNYVLDGPLKAASEVPNLQLKVALNQLQALTKDEDYVASLDRLQQKLTGSEGEAEENQNLIGSDAVAAAMSQKALEKVAQVAATFSSEEALAALAEEKSRYAQATGVTDAGEGTPAEQGVDPSMRVHMVMIAVSDE
eukprot:CAMPEP_0197698514 /NCGR_PEP_ID=MMETSP1338-20131121/119437_1 /TAXON_ID=43686 ORGANISM="Pelagodinium beii, Strain RCC1491" /NCGR_SAMPLE_ID=MMETSP1338 /ASSEMBLY_ACC=CAM_ASM_000754 /LENGTH=459 /DNA_ID=CAMNT_0043281921 /DNA_START=84 /DNA_END=1460 /DNA_ORIENTATION=+